MPAVILYDGDCRACQAAVRIVLPRDTAGHFRFASQGSSVGERLLADHGLSAEGGRTLVLIEDGRAFLRSEAALRIASHLGGPWRLAAVLRALPRPLRDAAYDLFVRNRARLSGRAKRCMAIPAAQRDRFLDQPGA